MSYCEVFNVRWQRCFRNKFDTTLLGHGTASCRPDVGSHDDILTELPYGSDDEAETVHGGSGSGRAGKFERRRKRYPL